MKRFLLIIYLLPMYSFSFPDFIPGKYEYREPERHLLLVLNRDHTYRLVRNTPAKNGMLYDRTGVWERENDRLKLIFMGYDIPLLQQADIVYRGCGKVERNPIAIYEYKIRGNKLKPVEKEKSAGVFKKVRTE